MEQTSLRIPDSSEWKSAYNAFSKCVGTDTSITIQYSVAWTATMEAIITFYNEVIKTHQLRR